LRPLPAQWIRSLLRTPLPSSYPVSVTGTPSGIDFSCLSSSHHFEGVCSHSLFFLFSPSWFSTFYFFNRCVRNYRQPQATTEETTSPSSTSDTPTTDTADSSDIYTVPSTTGLFIPKCIPTILFYLYCFILAPTPNIPVDQSQQEANSSPDLTLTSIADETRTRWPPPSPLPPVSCRRAKIPPSRTWMG
jgi:hypothetical protein